MDWATLLSGITKPFFDTIGSVLDKTITDKNARAKAREDILVAQAKMQADIVQGIINNAQAQVDVNKVEAASAIVFVAGWRPAIGWICGAAMAWQYVLEPMATWGITVAQGIWVFTTPPLPVLDTSQMMTVLLGMLGLGGLRTYERVKDVSRSSLKGDSIDQP
jgi:hypothetical protein